MLVTYTVFLSEKGRNVLGHMGLNNCLLRYKKFGQCKYLYTD